MALFTICATDKTQAAKPCAIIEALSEQEALDKAVALHDAGELSFLPYSVLLSARRAARRELRAWQTFMLFKPSRAPVAVDGGTGARSHRLALAFFEKIWRGEITLSDAP